MAVLLEGINITEGNPITINIYRDGTWVNAYTTEDGNAIEVPEPHGRLGDLDALPWYLANTSVKYATYEDWEVLCDAIAEAPTAITASGRESNGLRIDVISGHR